MRTIHLEPPQIQGQIATFRWRIVPETPLYRQTRFVLRFPPEVDLARVPERLWWDVLLVCLHAHWLILRPCQIHLPLRLGSAERQFWLALLRNGAETLEAYAKAQRPSDPLGIEIVDGAREIPRTIVAGSGCGTAFSGGKDSLLQAALLAELTERPLLVATTSPMPPTVDHETLRRRQVFAAIQARRHLRFVEVHSDFRASWDNAFAVGLGYDVGINELTDSFLYLASLLAAGAALGVSRLFLASEAEVQESTAVDGKIVQHSHFMYSAATQRALARLLSPYGLHYGSLTWPLYSVHVQELLWARYPDLCDLQYSCWRVGKDQATCSQCNQCLRIAVTALAARHDPRRMGIDLEKVIAYAQRWAPRSKEGPAPSPRVAVMWRFDALILDAMRRTSLLHLAAVLAKGGPRRWLARSTFEAIRGFHRLRKRARRAPAPPAIGVREAFCDWLDPALRDRLIAIYRQHLPLEPRSQHRALHERSATLTARATAALH